MSKDFQIRVPDELGDKDLIRFFLGWKWHEDPPSNVVLDFSRVKFIAAWAAAMFGSYGRWLQDVRGRTVDVWVDAETTAGQFLLRIGLPQFLGKPVASTPWTSPERFVPLTQIQSSSNIHPCVVAIMKLLAIEDTEMVDAIQYSLIELIRNVVQHAGSGIGAVVTAVYMPTTGLVEVAVADIGCGIRASLHERYREIKDDITAVKFAMQPHVSGTFQRGAYESMSSNAGLGLFFIKEIVTRSSGGFYLSSGSMLANLWGNRDGSPGKRYFSAKASGWRGTFALLQMRRDTIGEFDALLQRCREIAAEVRRDPTELKLDFINEVPDLEGLVAIHIKDFEEDVEAADGVRENNIFPALEDGRMVVLDFSGIRAATQSFAHALMYRVFRDSKGTETSLSIACADSATQEAIRAVAAYAKVPGS